MSPQCKAMLIRSLVFGVYFPLLTVISLFVLYKIKMVAVYFITRRKTPIPTKRFQSLPFVTIQLPLYNESEVVERLLTSAAELDYPRNLFEVQVLDDSTDGSERLSRRLVKRFRKQGFQFELIHREDRKDFKAGALAHGLKYAKGEFVAVFDSDFIIPRHFLRETIHFFTQPEIGMVQARWGFLNEAQSLLTRIQSTFLNGHFVIEHCSRSRSGNFFNFNGTAGIWRKDTISDAGGWEGDTLTEDLDLSYRAQLKGWRFVYLKDLIAYSELPPTLDAYNGQQFRWAKGMVQVMMKLLGRIWTHPASLYQKIDASIHLGTFMGYIWSVLISLITLPILAVAKEYIDAHFFHLALFFVITNFLMLYLFYVVSDIEARGLKIQSFVYPACLIFLGVGFSVNGIFAVGDALKGRKTPFIRTPKFNCTGMAIKSENNAGPVYGVLGVVALYFVAMIVYIFAVKKPSLLMAAAFFAPGYWWLLWLWLRERTALAPKKS
ncbi:MAG: glycosyltransferase [Chitinivibrionales bacterium]|nr:glycosyltransferase [Chitinivibrionales bacterium]MBD3355516.1 glycosyltransferase [Chitinivibrionales bacterium]